MLASNGVRMLPMPNPAIEAMAPAVTEATKTSAENMAKLETSKM
jgi:hypothetical protein